MMMLNSSILKMFMPFATRFTHCSTETQMTWYIQIQDKDNNVLLLNQEIGNYQKYSKFVDNKAQKVVFQFPTAKRWEVRPQPYTSKVIL